MSWHPETVTSVSLTPRVSIFSRGFRDKADLGIDLCGTVVTADMSGLSTKRAEHQPAHVPASSAPACLCFRFFLTLLP